MPLDTIIFDLGGTLIEYAGPYAKWPDLETPGFTAAYNHLQSHNAPLPDLDTFMQTGFQLIPGRWQAATRGEANLTLANLLADTLHTAGLPNGNMALLADAAALYEQAICAQAQPIPSGKEVLAQLKAAGFKLGLISNTMFSGAAHIADMERFGLIDYFDAMLFSADENMWKPQPEPFVEMVARLGGTVETAVYIGDDPRADIVGAKTAGLRGIHFRSSDRFPPADIEPDATITALTDLPAILHAWAQSS